MEAVTRANLETAVLGGMMSAAHNVMQWGRDDCGLWCANILRDLVGYDPAQELRGRYKTRRGAMRVMGRKGLLGGIQRAARRHKWKRINPAMAQPGDVGMTWTTVETSKGPKPTLATVICRAPGWFVGRNEKGWTAVPARDVPIAWSVLDDHGPGARANLVRISGVRMVPTPVVAHAPVVAVVGAIATFSASSALASFVVSTALSLGVALLSSLLQPQTGTSLNNDNDTGAIRGQQITERQSIPFKRVIVGTAYVGGALFFERVNPPYLYMGILLNHGEIAGVRRVFIGTDELLFKNLRENVIFRPLPIDGTPPYNARLRMSLRYGSVDQALDPLIDDAIASVSAQYRQQGIATAVFEYDYGNNADDFLDLWGQVSRPNAYFIIDGVPAFDPRDPTQSMFGEGTWKHTNNASLIQAWYLTRPFGGRIPVRNIDWDKVAEAADYDDELIGCADGSLIARHTIDGVITLNQKPYEVMQKLLTANRGMVLESAGRVWVSSSKPKTPIATIHDGILAGSIRYQAAKEKSSLVNKLQVRFVAPEQEYQIVDGPILSYPIWQEDDQEVLPATLTLEYTQDHRRAQRLQHAYIYNSRLGKTITVPVDVAFMADCTDELIGSAVRFNSQLFSQANGIYLVTGVGFSEECESLSLALTEYDASIEKAWRPDVHEQPFELQPPP